VERFLDGRREGPGHYWQLWRLLSLETWLQTYLPRLSDEIKKTPDAQRPVDTREVVRNLTAPCPADVIITIDYETFDTNDLVLDGGLEIDWERDLIGPTERFASLLEKHGAKLTVLWDTAEYFWLVDTGLKQTAGRIRKQLIDLVRRGHDVQLHLHPAWASVRRRGKRWVWEKPALTAPTMKPKDFETLVARSVETMERLFRPIRSDYAVRGFRGRSYEVEPFSVIAGTLMKYGIRADSSYHGVGPIPVRVPSLTQAVPPRYANFLEFPIYSMKGKRWDFSGPLDFASLPLETLNPTIKHDIALVMIGHSQQKIHFDDVDRCLSSLRDRYGDVMRFVRWQDAIETRHRNLNGHRFPDAGFSKDYFETRWEEPNPFNSAFIEDPYYQRILELLPQNGGSLLDLGCGEGAFTQALASRSRAQKVLGVDISEQAIQKARQSFPKLQFQAANLLRLQRDEQYTCIVCSQSIYYFAPAERSILFGNIENMLAPDGRFILAWWLGAKRGYQEEDIEEEFDRFFRIEYQETYRATPHDTIKGEHRILIGRRRISLDEEILNTISWKDARVLDLSARSEDLKKRYGWLSKTWMFHPEGDHSAQKADILIADSLEHIDLNRLRPNGTFISYSQAVVQQEDGDLDDLLFVKANGSLFLSAKSR
jgi:SAM-dependent methyltransferase